MSRTEPRLTLGDVPLDASVSSASLVSEDEVSISKTKHISGQDVVDENVTFFFHPRSLTALALLFVVLMYRAFNSTQESFLSNFKSGIVTASFAFILVGMIQLRDGPFIRPHPVMWRAVQAVAILYQMILIILLFQNKADARELMKQLDPSLGHPLPERSYAEDCTLTWEVIVSQVDAFVLAHSIGWFCKALILRDYWFCWILSVAFEVMEYSLAHQLHNFAECWWDHWILDVLVCNWLGTYLGMKTCEYFEMKGYSWRGMGEIPSYKGKLRRGVQQFTPHSWTRFDWHATDNWRNYLAVIGLLFAFLMCELNAFYLKYLLWIPAVHWINVLRLLHYFLSGIPSVREAYQYLSDPRCKRFGTHAWLQLANVVTEFLIILKFSDGEFPVPMPVEVKVFWVGAVACMVGYGVYKFWWLEKASGEEREKVE